MNFGTGNASRIPGLVVMSALPVARRQRALVPSVTASRGKLDCPTPERLATPVLSVPPSASVPVLRLVRRARRLKAGRQMPQAILRSVRRSGERRCREMIRGLPTSAMAPSRRHPCPCWRDRHAASVNAGPSIRSRKLALPCCAARARILRQG